MQICTMLDCPLDHSLFLLRAHQHQLRRSTSPNSTMMLPQNYITPFKGRRAAVLH